MNQSILHNRDIRSGCWLVGLLLLLGCDAWDLKRLPAKNQPPVDTTRTSTLANGLVAYYPFSGTTLDVGGNNQNGLLINGATYGPDRTAASQSALLLDGIDDYFEIPDNARFQSDAISISVWIKPKQVTSTNHIYNKANWLGNTNQQYSAFIRPPRPLPATDPCCAIWADVNQDGSCDPEQPIQQPVIYYDPAFVMNRWYHLVTVFSGKIGKIYVNGELRQSGTEQPAGPIDNCTGGNLRFGAQADFDVNYFNGSMDEIRVYNRLLTDVEVNHLYKL